MINMLLRALTMAFDIDELLDLLAKMIVTTFCLGIAYVLLLIVYAIWPISGIVLGMALAYALICWSFDRVAKL